MLPLLSVNGKLEHSDFYLMFQSMNSTKMIMTEKKHWTVDSLKFAMSVQIYRDDRLFNGLFSQPNW